MISAFETVKKTKEKDVDMKTNCKLLVDMVTEHTKKSRNHEREWSDNESDINHLSVLIRKASETLMGFKNNVIHHINRYNKGIS